MTQPIAYEFSGMTFCPDCAYRCSVPAIVVGGLGFPTDMDDVIARMTLAQIENGSTIDTPVGVMTTEVPECENCHSALSPVPTPGGEAA